MATQLYLTEYANTVGYIHSGEQYTKLIGGSPVNYWRTHLATSRGSSVLSYTALSVAGPTNGIEAATAPRLFISQPLATDTSISGSITFNLRGAESSMSANAAMNCRILRLSATDGSFTEVYKTSRTSEVGTSETTSNWSEVPGAALTFNRGDRIVVSMFFGDAGTTMASGYTLTFYYNGSSGATGDSWIQFTEDLTFESAPGGTTVYPTATSAGINPGAATEYEAWTSRGSGVASAVTNTASGPTSPIQITATAGGTAIEWYTKPLQATTLSGAVLVNARAAESSTSANATVRCEIARVDGDGTNPTVWGIGAGGTAGTTTYRYVALGASEAAAQFWVGGDDLAITTGQRLRIRFYIDDASAAYAYLVASYTATLYYAGTSAGASGDTYLTFPITLTEAGAVTVSDDFLVEARVAPSPGSSTLDSVILATRSGSPWHVDAWKVAPGSGALLADAIVIGSQVGSTAMAAWVAGAIKLDAVLSRGQSDDFPVAAFVSAYPEVIDADTQHDTVTSDSDTWSLTYPTNLETDDLILVFLAVDGGDSTVPSMPAGGWSRIYRNQGAVGLLAAAKVATGGETGSFSVGLASAQQGAWRAFRVRYWYGSGLWPDKSTNQAGFTQQDGSGLSIYISDGTDATPSLGPLNPTYWGTLQTIWFAALGIDASRTIISYPAGYSGTSADVSGGTGGATLALARLASAVSAETPGDYTIDSADDWVGFVVGVRPVGSQRTWPFSVDSTIERSSTESFPLDARIGDPITTEYGDFLSSAWIAGAFPLDARIGDATATGNFNLDALILRSAAGSSQIAACIATLAFADGFGRTVAEGMGLHWTQVPDDTYEVPFGTSYISVAGIASLSAPVPYASESWLGFPRVATAVVQFDFWVPDADDQGTAYGFPAQPNGQNSHFRVAEVGSGEWKIFSNWGLTKPSVGVLDVDTWHTAKFAFGGPTGYYAFGKVWKVGDPEPDWIDLGSNSQPYAYAIDYPYFDWWTAPLYPAVAQIDNLFVWTLAAPWQQYGGLLARAEIGLASITGAFVIDAALGRFFMVEASFRTQARSLFEVAARIARNIFHLDASISPWAHIDAIVVSSSTGFTHLDAFIFDGSTRELLWRIDAIIDRTAFGSFKLQAFKRLAWSTGSGSAPISALVLGPVAGSFPVAASIFSSTISDTFPVAADLSAAGEERGSFVVAAVRRTHVRDLFEIHAYLTKGSLHVSAWLAGAIKVDAFIVEIIGANFLVDARVAPPTVDGDLTLDATIFVGRQASFAIDAAVASEGGGMPGLQGSFPAAALVLATRDDPWPAIWLSANIFAARGGSFTVAAWVRGHLQVAAWLAFPGNILYGGTLPLAAYIMGNTTIIWPEDGGPPTDGQGNPLPPWFKASRKYRIGIFIDGVDVTGDVIWSKTSFKQHAKTNPGTFEITLDGTTSYDGGETVIVNIDDFRAFGGYVLSVERVYAFREAGPPLTVLRGADFNILFDKLIVYNKASASGSYGAYANWQSFSKGSSDTKIINKVFSSYVDLPPGFDYTTYVEAVGVAAIETPWMMPQPGSSLRSAMQSISQVTNAVWWIDPYLKLHYQSRSSITAPYPITDSVGGITGQGLSVESDISKTVTDTILWGTLAYTVSGEIMYSREASATQFPLPLQYGEFRSDIHHQSYIDRRAASIIERYGEPIKRAKVAIFEPGYQAGQVAQVRLDEHGIDAELVIRELDLSIAVAKEPVSGVYYGVPRYELVVGLDPEEPWDIYDYLPWPDDAGTNRQRFQRREEGDCGLCGITDTFDRGTTDLGDLGISDAGLEWLSASVGLVEYQVYQNRLRFSLGGGSSAVWAWLEFGDTPMPNPDSRTFSLTFRITIYDQEIAGESDGYVDWRWTRDQYISGSRCVLEMGTGGTLRLTSYGLTDSSLSPFALTEDQAYMVRWEQEAGVEQRVKFWPLGEVEPSEWDLTQSLVGMPDWNGVGFGFQAYNTGSAGLQIFWNDLDIEGIDYCAVSGNNLCDDPEGELFGMIGEGFNCETLSVEGGIAETTARVSRGTVRVWDEDGLFLLPGIGWQFADSGGQRLTINSQTQTVHVCYRAYVVNVRSEYSVPRSQSAIPPWNRPIPI